MSQLSKALRKVPFLKGRSRDSGTASKSISKELVRQYVGKRTPTILEIGCNDGTHTLWFHKIFRKPQIYCFEPEPRAIARFKSKVGKRSNVKLFEMAISDQIGEITFHQSDGQNPGEKAKVMPEGWDFSGSIRKPKNHLTDHPWVRFDKCITVKTSTLDAWFDDSGIKSVDFIWMDVQGAENDVFKGAKKTLAKTRYVYTEYNNTEQYEGQSTLDHLLEELGHFEVVLKYPDDVLLRNTLIES